MDQCPLAPLCLAGAARFLRPVPQILYAQGGKEARMDQILRRLDLSEIVVQRVCFRTSDSLVAAIEKLDEPLLIVLA